MNPAPHKQTLFVVGSGLEFGWQGSSMIEPSTQTDENGHAFSSPFDIRFDGQYRPASHSVHAESAGDMAIEPSWHSISDTEPAICVGQCVGGVVSGNELPVSSSFTS